MSETCPATFKHWHGTATCRHAPGHEGQHLGTCWSCYEDGADSGLRWDEMHKDGTVPCG